MIDFGDFIKSQRGNVDYRRRKKIRIDDISNRPTTIEEAKAKVQAILDSGAMKRKKIKKRKKHEKDPEFENHSYIS